MLCERSQAYVCAWLIAPAQKLLWCRHWQQRRCECWCQWAAGVLAVGACAVAAVLHDLTLALQADRVLLMAGGRLRADGAPGDAGLHASLADVFQGSVTIARARCAAGERWVALPSL